MATFLRALACGVALVVAAGLSAQAGGDDYDAPQNAAEKGPSYFGFVRDTRGVPVAAARVVLQPKAGAPVELTTNVLGLYRSHVDKDVAPDEVAVSCAKEGYRLTAVTRRPRAPDAATVETHCTLQRL